MSQTLDDTGAILVKLIGNTTQHDILSLSHSDTSAASAIRGDLIVGNSTPKWSRLALGSANAFLKSDGLDASWSTGLLAITAAKTLTVQNSLTLAGTDGKTLTLTGSLTVPSDGTAVLTTRAVNTSGLGLSGGGDLSADRTITLASSSNPGAAASILASDASGQLTLVNLLANTTAFSLVNTTATTVNFAGAATTLNLGAASCVVNGAGGVTLNGGIAANNSITIQGTSHATRTSSYVLVQPNGGNVGIEQATPTAKLEISQAAGTGTVVPLLTLTGAAHTALTASTERFDSNFNGNRTVQWATGALTTQRFNLFQAPTIGFVGASTVTDTATVAISGAPIKGVNATLTSTHGLLIQAGAVSTATNAYGLTVNAPTGATSNYAAAFLSGNVGIGTTGPTYLLSLGGNAARNIWMERHTTANTAGNSLTVQSGGATSAATDKAGGDLILAPGLSTGTGNTKVRVQAATKATSTGTADNTLVDRLVITGAATLTDAATSLFDVALAAGGMTGGTVLATIEASDGTDHQAFTQIINYAAVNKAGSYTTTVTVNANNDAKAVSAGTLTTSWALVSGTNKVTLQVTPAGSLVETIYRLTYVVFNNGPSAVTIL